MARIRSIKPEFWDDRRLAKATSRDARLLYIGLWNLADEHSRLNGDPVWIAARVFPYDSDIGADECARLLDELARGDWVQKYTVRGDPYLFLPSLAKHQRLEPDKVPSRLPSPMEADTKPASDLHTPIVPDESASRADESAPDADQSALLYVAGSREHVAGSMSIAPRTRAADDTWDAVMVACNVDAQSIPPSARGGYNKAVADLKAVGATPSDIRQRAHNFQLHWPDISLTPTALARRWAEVAEPPRRDYVSRRQRETNAMFDRALTRAREADAREAGGR